MSDVRKRYLERNAVKPAKPEPGETVKGRRGRPSKAEAEPREETRPHDAEVLRAAAALLNMTANKDAHRFGVTRQTLTKWMRGETSAPRAAYVLLLDEVLKAIEAGTANINAAAEARLNRAIDERIAAALKIMEHLNKAKGEQA